MNILTLVLGVIIMSGSGPMEGTDVDYNVQVALGQIPGANPLFITGENPNVGPILSDVSDFGSMVFPTAAESWEIISDNVNDTLLGTGLRQVLVETLDGNYDITTVQVIDMDGDNAVAVAGTHLSVRLFFGFTAGSNENNIGTVDLRVAGGGNVRARMRPTKGRSFNSFYVTPNGKTSILSQSASFIPKGEDAIVGTVTQNNAIPNAIRQSGGEVPTYQNSIVLPIKAAAILPEKVGFWFEAVSTNTPVSISTISELIEYDNDVFSIDSSLLRAQI